MPYAKVEDRRAQVVRWKEQNKARSNEHTKAWFARNPDYMRLWRAENKERIRAYRAKARAGGQGRYVRLGLRKQDAAVLDALKVSGCVYCGSIDNLHIDHIIPRSVGGGSGLGNLQWLCSTCNTSKGAMTSQEFIAHIRKILMRFQ